MARELTAAQRRVIGAADPGTGRLRGSAAVLDRLVRLGLAFRHPRPPHDCFLTPAGRRARTAPPEPPSSPGTEPAPAPRPAADGVFAARGGEESEPPADPAARAREVRAAWEGLLELRRMTRADGDTGRPCAWERAHLVRAAALALEAAGRVPAVAGRGGYVVRESPQPEAVEVRVVGTAGPGAGEGRELARSAEALEAAGWQVSEHGDRRGGRVVIASPPRR
ncbi:hypothetical protein [Streptomyces sp. NRRL F-5630]|uniref:hypothetical protein n=1 Tax=Streptomyces sp. NRRL F-5630 TaxID=1463864 RepID=UPI003D7424AD